MPIKYSRKTNRASWTEAELQMTIEKVANKSLNAFNASKLYNVPYITLKRRLISKNKSSKTLGKHPRI